MFRSSNLFTIDEDLQSISTNSPGLINISSDSGEEFVTEQSYVDPIDLRFRAGGPLQDPMLAFVNEDAARLFAVSETVSREDSFIDVIGTDIEREILSTITENTELPDFSLSSFVESDENNEDNLLLNADFANAPRNSYGRPVVAVLPMRAGEVITQMPPLSQSNVNNSLNNLHRNGPIRPVPITPMVVPQEIPIVNQPHQNNRTRGILQTPLRDQNFNPNTQQHMPILTSRGSIPFQYAGKINIQHPSNLDNSGYYYNSAGQQYLDPQGVHNNPGVAEIYPTQAYSSMQEQPTHRRVQLNPPVMPHVQENCHWCGKTYDEVALDALAAYTIATEYPGETVRDRNIRSRAYLDGFEAALICFKNAGLSQPRACAGPVEQR